MKLTERAKNAAPYAERLLTNSYVQENLSNATERLRAAYERGRKRRISASRDEKIRRQVREAASSMRAAADGLRTGREKPKRSVGKMLAAAGALGVAGAAAALALSEDLRAAVFGGDDDAPVSEPAATNGTPSEEKVTTSA
jgi:hypothetical protein